MFTEELSTERITVPNVASNSGSVAALKSRFDDTYIAHNGPKCSIIVL